MQEFQLLRTLFNLLEPRFISLPDGPGDDCAIISSKEQVLISQDILVEGVHFKSSWSSPRDIAWKALATNESDIASMGGRPIGYTIGLMIPDGYGDFVEELYIGFNEYLLSRESSGFFQKILGGDISSGPCFSISVGVLGECQKPILRSGGKQGDLLVVSGEIGLSSIGLDILNGNNVRSYTEEFIESAIKRHKRPSAKTELGRFLNEHNLATAMIDVSDGLLQDISHIARASELSALIEPEVFKLPHSKVSCEDRDELLGLLSSGEDYELVFSVSSQAQFDIVKANFPDVFIVGQLISKQVEPLVLLSGGKEVPLVTYFGEKALQVGYQHCF